MREPRKSDHSGANPPSLTSPPFFIMGCPRSGTTLVSQILDSHSRLAVFQETMYYTLFRPGLHCYGDLSRPSNLRHLIADFLASIRLQDVQGIPVPDPAEFQKMLAAPTAECVLATFLNLFAQQQGKVRGGEKMPGHYTYIPEILDRFPGTAAIFLIRDPRDTVLSMRKAFDTRLEVAARSWSQAFDTYSRISDKLHMVRYEELVARPVEVSKGLCGVLGEEFEPDMLEFYARLPEGIRALPNVGLLEGPVVPASVGKFRKELSDRDIAMIEAVCAVGMRKMSYEFVIDPGVRPFAAAKTTKSREGPFRFLFDRLRYYGFNRERWRRGWFRWRLALRVRGRYLLSLGPLRYRSQGKP